MEMALVALFFAALKRSVSSNYRFIQVPSVTRSLVLLLGIVLATASATGGIGMRSLGSATYGGRNYFYVVTAIAGYFALTSRRIPVERAGLYSALFFLPGLTSLVAILAYKAGPAFYWLYYFFPADGVSQQASQQSAITPMVDHRFGLLGASTAIYCYILAKYGLRGIFDVGRPWRMLLLVLTFLASLMSGFRGSLIMLVLMFAIAFWLEGLHRTRLLPILGGVCLLGSMLVLPNTERLPLSAQRTLSFLPVKTDPMAELSARASTEWRLQMWREVIPQIPKYLVVGKGYALDPEEMFGANLASYSSGQGWLGSMTAGDYHNGPLSVIIPFGIFGVIAFLWFLGASIRYLYYVCRFGDLRVRQINTFLFGFFIAKVVFFFLIFGGFYSELYSFTGLIGLAVSLNGPALPRELPTQAETALRELSPAVY
jgi:hypothetical protein